MIILVVFGLLSAMLIRIIEGRGSRGCGRYGRLIVFTVLSIMAVAASCNDLNGQQIIAHRGFHATQGAAHNTIASLINAQEAGCYGSECDLNLTADGALVVAHGPYIGEGDQKMRIQSSTLEQLRSVRLSNGEVVPTFEEYLLQASKAPACKLIIEIKNHTTPQIESRAVQLTVDAVARHNMQRWVEYIAFRDWVCFELVRVAPQGTPIAYLNGTLTPEYLKAVGCTGLDYNISVFKRHPEWIEEAHRLGMTVNIWTIDSTEELQWAIDHKADYLTTNNPTEAARLLAAAAKECASERAQ